MMGEGYWLAEAEYADGTEVSYEVPYQENDNYAAEERRIHEIEEDLMAEAVAHGGIVSWHVVYQADDE